MTQLWRAIDEQDFEPRIRALEKALDTDEGEDTSFDARLDALEAGTAPLYHPAPTGSVARPYVAKFAEQISMLDFCPWTTAQDIDMPAGSGAKISDYLMGAGRKCLFIPARKFIFHEGGNPGALYAFGATGAHDISIIGEGPERSIVTIANDVNVGIINIGALWPSLPDVPNISLSSFAIDGNQPNNTGLAGVHGVRFGGYHDNLRVWNMAIRRTVGYGLGFQEMNSGANGYYKHVKVGFVHIDGAGSDGIDFKSAEGVNEDIQLSNISVYNFNQQLTAVEHTGIDIRGQAQLSNIRVKGTPGATDNSGIRFRAADGGSRTSGVSNFWVELSTNYPANLAADVLTVGVDMEVADCYAVNGYVKGCDSGVSISNQAHCKVAHVVAEGCAIGFSCSSSTSMIEDCTAFNSTVADIGATSGARIVNCRFYGVPAPLAGSATPEREAVAVTSSGSGLVGLMRNPAGELAYYSNASETWRWSANNTLTAYPAATFVQAGKLNLPAGDSSRPAIAVRGASTSNEPVFSFENANGVLVTVSLNGNSLFFRDSAGAVLLTFSLGKLGFFAAPAVVKPTVTGAKGANAALTSLLAGLVSLGLITDTTTA